jgi:hypothetical protein
MTEACVVMGDAISIGLYETGENLRDHLQDLDVGGGVCMCFGMYKYMYLHDTTASIGP